MANISAREQVYKALSKKIIHMELVPGQALNDKELAEELGVSRTPVREAIIMLSMSNLVTMRPQSGTYVEPVNLDLVAYEQYTRCAIEKELVRNACKTITKDHIALYEENLHLYNYYLTSNLSKKERELLKLDDEFHKILFLINNKENYYEHSYSQMFHMERLRILSVLSKENNFEAKNGHENIFKAIVDGNCEKAEALIEEHMMLYVQHIKKIKETFPEYFFIK